MHVEEVFFVFFFLPVTWRDKKKINTAPSFANKIGVAFVSNFRPLRIAELVRTEKVSVSFTNLGENLERCHLALHCSEETSILPWLSPCHFTINNITMGAIHSTKTPWSKTQWNGSVQPEKFRKNGSTIWGGPLFPVGLVGIFVEWIAPYIYYFLKQLSGPES